MIHINLLRISTDSQYLEFSVECDTGYTFNHLYITRYDVIRKVDDNTNDASSLLAGTTNSEVMRIATSALGNSFGAEVTMYKVEFGVTPTNVGAPEIPNEVGMCSNVNFVYANLLDLIMSFTSCCISQSDYDNLDRNHMILYAHQEAMRLQRYNEATYFYDIIWNLFQSCGPTTRQSNIVNKPCNCGS
ncbi:MAG: hypothetical protein ACOH2V_00200 [Candidatus Saccharimonadaceae bacterium]